MGYAEDQLAQYQQKIKDLVDPATIPAQRKAVSDRMAAVQGRFAGDVSDILGGQMAAGDVSQKYTRDMGYKNDAVAAKFEANRKRTIFNQYYNYAMQMYLDQGKSLRDSEAFARQWAADQAQMKVQEDASAASRQDRTNRLAVSNQYQTAADQLKVDTGNPYEQALMRSLFGLATTAATYKIVDSKMNKPTQIPPIKSTPVAGEGMGSFDPNEYFYDYFPYMRSGSGNVAGS